MDKFAAVKILRLLAVALFALAVGACASWGNKEKKGTMRNYDGDESPYIKMYEEGPGSPLHN